MTIYVVTKGEYSGYHIITATTNKRRAEKIAKIYSDEYEKAEVEAFAELSDNELSMIESKLEQRYVFNIQRDGSVSEIDVLFVKKNKPNMFTGAFDTRIDFCIAANDKEHAIKIARDMRFKYIAEKFGL